MFYLPDFLYTTYSVSYLITVKLRVETGPKWLTGLGQLRREFYYGVAELVKYGERLETANVDVLFSSLNYCNFQVDSEWSPGSPETRI